jgi:hypothetical protein
MTTAASARHPGWASAAGRGAVLAAAAVGLALVHLPGRPTTLCALRALTGVPCPLCGGTTAFVDLGHGRVGAALAASPIAVLGGVAVVLAPLRAWRPLTPQARRVLVLVVGVASELWQLHRFGLL